MWTEPAHHQGGGAFGCQGSSRPAEMAAGLSQPPFHTCLLVISRYPSSCPSALGLFRFRLQSATELNVPSETSKVPGEEASDTSHCSALLLWQQHHRIISSVPALLLQATQRPARPGSFACKSQATRSTVPPSWRARGCLPTHCLIHTQRMKVWLGLVSLFPATPIFPFFLHCLILTPR